MAARVTARILLAGALAGLMPAAAQAQAPDSPPAGNEAAAKLKSPTPRAQPAPADQLPLDKLKLPPGFRIEVYASGIAQARALRIGMRPADQLLAEAGKLMRAILANGPLALKLTMEAVDRGLDVTLEEGLRLEADAFGLVAATDDMKEGLTAFLEKRPAKFQGK